MASSPKARKIRTAIAVLLMLGLGQSIWWALRLFKLAEAQRSHIQEMVTVDINGDGERDLIVGYEAPNRDSGSILAAIDGKTGRTIWERSTLPIDRPMAPASHMALAKDSLVLLRRLRQSGAKLPQDARYRWTLSRYALANGKRVWHRKLPAAIQHSFGIIVEGDLVLQRLMMRTEKLTTRLVAHSLADGAERWSHAGIGRYVFSSTREKIIASGLSKVLIIDTQSGKAEPAKSSLFPIIPAGDSLYSFLWQGNRALLARLSPTDAQVEPVEVGGATIALPELSAPQGVVAISDSDLWVAVGKGSQRNSLTRISLKDGGKFTLPFADGFGPGELGILDPLVWDWPELSAYGRLKARYLPLVLRKDQPGDKTLYRLVVLDTKEMKITWRSKPTDVLTLFPLSDIYAKSGRYFFVVSLPHPKRGFPLQTMLVLDGASGKFRGAFYARFKQKKWRFENYPKPMPANFTDDALWGFLNAQAWRIDLATLKLQKYGLGKIELVPAWKRVEAFLGPLPRESTL